MIPYYRENAKILTTVDTLKTWSINTIIYIYIHIFVCVYNDDQSCHDVVIKWKYFLRYWPFVRVIHRSHKGQ